MRPFAVQWGFSTGLRNLCEPLELDTKKGQVVSLSVYLASLAQEFSVKRESLDPVRSVAKGLFRRMPDRLRSAIRGLYCRYGIWLRVIRVAGQGRGEARRAEIGGDMGRLADDDDMLSMTTTTMMMQHFDGRWVTFMRT
jgi:hypothetical protein